MGGYKGEIHASEADAEALADILGETLDPAPAISTRRTDTGWVMEIYFNDWPDKAVLGSVLEGLPFAEILEGLELEPLPDENWVEKSQRGLHPIQAGRFYIHGSYDRVKAASKPFSIEIDAGQAFGTAHHGTTRGCLVLLDRIARKSRPRRVLDLGTGSGILAIAAAKSLSRQVLATDLDAVAVRVAEENIGRNGVKGRVKAICAAGLKDTRVTAQAPFDLVIANILADPLVKLAPGIRRVVARGGDLILSGLLDHQAREVSAVYLAQGFSLAAKLSLDGWTSLHLRL